MKASVYLVASALILCVTSFCSCISLPAEVKDAMVKNHRAHVVKLIPFVEGNNIPSEIEALQYKNLNSEISSQREREDQFLISSQENQFEFDSSDNTMSSQDGEDSVKISNEEEYFQPSNALLPSLLYQMMDSISRIQFLFLHSSSVLPFSSFEEGDDIEEEEEEAQNSMSAAHSSMGSSSSSSSSPCSHSLRGSKGLVSGDESLSDTTTTTTTTSSFPIFLFFKSPLQFFTSSPSSSSSSAENFFFITRESQGELKVDDNFEDFGRYSDDDDDYSGYGIEDYTVEVEENSIEPGEDVTK